MGFIKNLRDLRRKEKLEVAVKEYFEVFNGYSPAFSTFEGGIYEMELTRAAVHSFANHCSKLKPVVNGSRNEAIQRMLQTNPNYLMDAKKYLYRIATVLETDNTAIIVPLYDKNGGITGFYPLDTKKCMLVTDDNGHRFIKYQFDAGLYGACELERVGRLTKFQKSDELFGENNAAFRPTLELINAQNQGIVEGVKNSAAIRFLAKLANTLKPEDVEKERERFAKTNLGASNNGGVLLIDQKYESAQQINSTPYTVSDAQLKVIQDSVYNYFGTNEAILQNKYTSDQWNAYYEGKIEPFAIESSLVHSNMIFSDRERAVGNEVIFTANRLQYLSGSEKLNIVTQLFDRGFITHNEGLEIFNMAPVEGGDKRYIRKEYIETENLSNETGNGETGQAVQPQGKEGEDDNANE